MSGDFERARILYELAFIEGLLHDVIGLISLLAKGNHQDGIYLTGKKLLDDIRSRAEAVQKLADSMIENQANLMEKYLVWDSDADSAPHSDPLSAPHSDTDSGRYKIR